MPGKCEHGLTTKECLVCASPKYGAAPAASQIETAARAAIKARDTYGWSPEADVAINKLRAVLADESRCDGCGKTIRDHDSMLRCHPAPTLPEPDLEDHEYELWGQNARGDFFSAEKLRAYAEACVIAATAECSRHWQDKVGRAIAEAVEVALTPQQAAPVAPAGWCMVPAHPTRDMLNAAIDAHGHKLCEISALGIRQSPQWMFEQSYKAMLDAAPQPAPEPPSEEGQTVYSVTLDRQVKGPTV